MFAYLGADCFRMKNRLNHSPAKKPQKPKPFFKLIRNLLKFQFFLVIIYITVKKFLNHLILYFKISSIGSILRLIESDMDLVIPKTMVCMDWWHTFFFDFPIVFRVYDFFYSFYLMIKEEMCRNKRWNVPYLVYVVFERSKHHWCRIMYVFCDVCCFIGWLLHRFIFFILIKDQEEH